MKADAHIHARKVKLSINGHGITDALVLSVMIMINQKRFVLKTRVNVILMAIVVLFHGHRYFHHV